MATDPDRQSDGHPSRPQRRVLSKLPVGAHAAFQVLWVAAVAVPLAARVSVLANTPSTHAALSIVMVTGIWALAAALVWALRVTALTSCGRWGERTRHRVRTVGRRRIDP